MAHNGGLTSDNIGLNWSDSERTDRNRVCLCARGQEQMLVIDYSLKKTFKVLLKILFYR